MRACEFWKKQSDPAGKALTVTLESTGTATCLLLPTGQLIFDIAAAAVNKYLSVIIPFQSRVIGASIIHGNATSSNVALQTAAAAAITDAMAPSTDDKKVKYADTIDDTYSALAEDAVLKLAITTGAFTGIVIVELQPY